MFLTNLTKDYVHATLSAVKSSLGIRQVRVYTIQVIGLIHPFVRGREYIRANLLEFIGSKQAQSGVLWGNLQEGCLICTSGGRHGRKAGYHDEKLIDGTWWYFGQGQKGDQSLTNPANAKLASRERSVLLFSSRQPTSKEMALGSGYGKFFSFQGCFNVVGHEVVTPTIGPRAADKLFRFRLIPADGDGVEITTLADNLPKAVDVASLRSELNVYSRSPAQSTIGIREYRRRSAGVHAYALLRASGVCEGCRIPAPFFDKNGRAFLEVHHMTRLADDGPDAPANVAALCPNCHRRTHFSADRQSFNQSLQLFIETVEANLELDLTIVMAD